MSFFFHNVKFVFWSQIQNSFNDFNNFNTFNISMRIVYNNKIKRWNYKINWKFSFNVIISKFRRARIELFWLKKNKKKNNSKFFVIFSIQIVFNRFNILMRIIYNNEVKQWNYKINLKFSFDAIISKFLRARIDLFECKKTKRAKSSEFASKNHKNEEFQKRFTAYFNARSTKFQYYCIK